MDCKKTILLTLRDNNFIFYFNGPAVSMSLQSRGLENDQKRLGFGDSIPPNSLNVAKKSSHP